MTPQKPISDMTTAEYKAYNAALIRWFLSNPHAIPKSDLLIDSAELAPPLDSVGNNQEATFRYLPSCVLCGFVVDEVTEEDYQEYRVGG